MLSELSEWGCEESGIDTVRLGIDSWAPLNVYKYGLWGDAMWLYSERNVGYGTIFVGADYITSPCLIVDSKVQPSTQTTTNANECFPNYSKMEQPIGKGRVRRRGREGVG
jgi:hypothetical protein